MYQYIFEVYCIFGLIITGVLLRLIQQLQSTVAYSVDSGGLTAIPTDIPYNALSLSITKNRIDKTEVNAFSDLRQCTSVVLTYNWVLDAEPGAFNGLTAVTTFQFCYNRLGRLFTNMFLDLVSCTTLDLYDNRIIEIESGSFNGVSHVTYLRLYNNEIKSLKVGTFEGLVDVTRIELYYNRINSIQDNAFTNLKKLRILDLKRNDLGSVRKGMFSGLESLTDLYLYGNRLSTLPGNVFDHLPSPLKLALREPSYQYPLDIPLKCDRNLCWLKQKEQQGSIRWYSSQYKARCADGVNWDTWECEETGNFLYIIYLTFFYKIYQIKKCTQKNDYFDIY